MYRGFILCGFLMSEQLTLAYIGSYFSELFATWTCRTTRLDFFVQVTNKVTFVSFKLGGFTPSSQNFLSTSPLHQRIELKSLATNVRPLYTILLFIEIKVKLSGTTSEQSTARVTYCLQTKRQKLCILSKYLMIHIYTHVLYLSYEHLQCKH